MKNILIISAVVLVLLVGSAWFARSNSGSSSGGTVISTNGFHWHPKLELYVHGEPVAIPQNIGLSGTHSPIHTHDDLPLIHMEFTGRVTEDETRLGVFFAHWGRDMRSFGDTMIMKVNGVENIEYENYHMKDGDVIQLYYE